MLILMRGSSATVQDVERVAHEFGPRAGLGSTGYEVGADMFEYGSNSPLSNPVQLVDVWRARALRYLLAVEK